MTPSDSVLEVRGLTVSRAGQAVIQDLSFDVVAGECLGVLGRNGAGKSTMVEALVGVIPSSSTRISLDGERVDGRSTRLIAHQGAVLVPEGRRLFGNMSVEENLVLGRLAQGSRRTLLDRDPYELVLATFPKLQGLLRQKANTLSGGEQQMVAVGRALMSAPRLLVIDEPTAGLSPTAVESMVTAFSALQREGLSILLVEQSVDVVADVCNRVAVLSGGTFVLDGAPDEVIGSTTFQAALFGTSPTGAP
jgi:branched-chain amino acid transport system ATP-binding protein